MIQGGGGNAAFELYTCTFDHRLGLNDLMNFYVSVIHIKFFDQFLKFEARKPKLKKSKKFL